MVYYDEMACAFLENNSKISARQSGLGESGQGLVEYILVLVVTCILILGLMSQFYKPFQQWMTSYMGPYLQCLLDVGELPSFGSSGDSGLCASEFQAGNGVYSKTTPIPSVSSSSSSSGGTENNSNSSSGKNSGGSGGGSSASSESNYRVKGFAVGKSKGADGPTEAASGGEVPLSQTRYFKSGGSSSEAVAVRQSDVVGISGLGGAEKERIEKNKEKVINAGSLGDGLPGSKNKKLELKEPDRKIASSAPEAPWSFSSYMKFAVILMIIIAIVLFLGGQILQISKSMEK